MDEYLRHLRWEAIPIGGRLFEEHLGPSVDVPIHRAIDDLIIYFVPPKKLKCGSAWGLNSSTRQTTEKILGSPQPVEASND